MLGLGLGGSVSIWPRIIYTFTGCSLQQIDLINFNFPRNPNL